LVRLWIKKCIQYKNNEAIVFAANDSRYTFEQFQGLYNSLAKGLLHIGVKKGQHVALISYNSPFWLALQIAAAKIGAVLVCLNTGYSKSELEYVLLNSDASTLILGGGDSKTQNFIQIFLQICPELESFPAGELNCAKLPNLKNIITIDNANCNGAYTLDQILSAGQP